jgi:hypothetical protein
MTRSQSGTGLPISTHPPFAVDARDVVRPLELRLDDARPERVSAQQLLFNLDP